MQNLELFQFQDGAVKRQKQPCTAMLKDGFQFQDGAVKSQTGGIVSVCQNIFQFQDGAVKSFARHEVR